MLELRRDPAILRTGAYWFALIALGFRQQRPLGSPRSRESLLGYLSDKGRLRDPSSLGVLRSNWLATPISNRRLLAKAIARCRDMTRTIGVIGDRWTLLILRECFLRTRRFEEFQSALGITRHLLAERLKKLVRQGVLRRTPYQEAPKRHEYILTQKGLDSLRTLHRKWPRTGSLIKNFWIVCANLWQQSFWKTPTY